LIFDGLTMVGTSINGYRLPAEELLASMDANGIGRSVIAPVQPASYHLEPENEAIAATQSRYPERFTGLCRVDPRQGEDAVSELRRCVLQLELKGLMLHPWEEGYTVSDAPAVRLVREAGSLGVPVFIATGYPWVAHATQVRAVAEAARETTIVMSHGGQINISGLAQADAFLAMEARENLCIGTNTACTARTSWRNASPRSVPNGSSSPAWPRSSIRASSSTGRARSGWRNAIAR
jgi:uncharacterized protein